MNLWLGIRECANQAITSLLTKRAVRYLIRVNNRAMFSCKSYTTYAVISFVGESRLTVAIQRAWIVDAKVLLKAF